MAMHVGFGSRFGFPTPDNVTLVQADGDELEAIRKYLPTLCPPIETSRVVRWEGSLARFVYEYGVVHAL